MGLQNGTRITAELRRSQVLQLKQAGASEQAIADQLGVSKTQINNDVKRRLAEIRKSDTEAVEQEYACLLYTSPSPRDRTRSRMPSSA